LVAVLTALTAKIPKGSTAAEFAQHTLNELQTIISVDESGPDADPAAATDWAMQLVCLRGQQLHRSEMAVPMAHSLQIQLDHVNVAKSDKQPRNILVVECRPRYSPRPGHHPNRVGKFLIASLHAFLLFF
jgi:hypothetical protein